MRSRCRALLAALLLAGPSIQAQAPQFDVASVKVNRGGPGVMTGGFCMGTDSTVTVTAPFAAGGTPASSPISPNSCQFRRTTLKEIVAAAFGIPRKDFERLIVGGPNWLDEDLFDIDARADGRQSRGELERKLQVLLAERFGLRTHPETRQIDGYALTVARGGQKMKAADAATASGIRTSFGALVTMTASAASMMRLADVLTLRLRKPVVDATGLAGAYTFALSWVPGEDEFSPFPPALGTSSPPPAESAPSGPSLVTALDERLGLRLEPRKVPVDVLVIDAASQPTPN
jgi:uncharacterized protein (TIGR03435 family)